MITLARWRISLAGLFTSPSRGIPTEEPGLYQPECRLSVARGPPQDPGILYLPNWASHP